LNRHRFENYCGRVENIEVMLARKIEQSKILPLTFTIVGSAVGRSEISVVSSQVLGKLHGSPHPRENWQPCSARPQSFVGSFTHRNIAVGDVGWTYREDSDVS